MAITTRDGLINALAAGQNIDILKASLTSQTAGRYISMFRVPGRPGANASTPGVTGNTLSSASIGAIPYVNPAAGQSLYVGQMAMTASGAGVALLIDLMVETGGLNATVTTAQTVNSVALPTRAGTGENCTVALACYGTVGTTASPTVTISYTNSAGTAGRTATVSGGIPASWSANQMLPATLQTGDTGVRSVQSVTSTTSTLTAGNFGTVIYKRHLEINLVSLGSTVLGWAETGLPIVGSDACLGFAVLPGATTSPQIVGSLALIAG